MQMRGGLHFGFAFGWDDGVQCRLGGWRGVECEKSSVFQSASGDVGFDSVGAGVNVVFEGQLRDDFVLLVVVFGGIGWEFVDAAGAGEVDAGCVG